MLPGAGRHWGEGRLGSWHSPFSVLVFFPSCSPLFRQFNRVAMGTTCTVEKNRNQQLEGLGLNPGSVVFWPYDLGYAT